ncbi:MAG: DUF1540 domain-containing protein [Candidatus Limiplasma sp.]|nr:DUF1540 domain-containing protein [Candidatus Limiplasma sp.]
MAFSPKNQCIHCNVASCKHWAQDDRCSLDSIKVAYRQDCDSGSCDESMCASYHTK